MTKLNDRMVALLLNWQQARSGLARNPQAHELADTLITLVREHDRSSPVPVADARTTIRMLEAFKSYLDVVDALVRALQDSGVAIVGNDAADLRNELTALITTLQNAAGSPAGSATQARPRPPIPTPAQVAVRVPAQTGATSAGSSARKRARKSTGTVPVVQAG